MKKVIFVLAVLLLILCSCSGKDDGVAGKWIDVTTEQIIEFTQDGYYYEYINESFTTEKTRYEVSNGMISFYLESDRENTEFSVPYEIKDNGNLIMSEVLEYKPMDIATQAEDGE